MHPAFHRLAVIGAGTMGLGIVEVLVASGFHVQLAEESKEIGTAAVKRLQNRLNARVEKGKVTSEIVDAMLNRIQPVDTLEELNECDLIIEAVVEKSEVKEDIFNALDEITSPDAILASNTSSLSITSIASKTKYPERVVGLHFFNPAPYMPLVEVVQGLRTDPQKVEHMMDWVRHLGKEPVKVMDSPGFLVNRVARPFHLEAYRLIGNGVASKEQVDRIVHDAGFKMGPFELQDLIGIDVNYAASTSVYNDYFQEPRFRPHPLQKMMVDSGYWGQKTKRGHYEYVE